MCRWERLLRGESRYSLARHGGEVGGLIADLEPWLREKLGLISQKSKLAEAIRYALARWEGLTRFLDDGRIEIDPNTVERSIRPIALSRKNALFAGSDGGGEDWGGRRPAGRNLQAQRRRSSRLSRRRACQDRQGPSQQPDRRSPAMGYVKAEPLKARGLKTPRTVLRADGGRANERQAKAQPTIRRAIDRTRLVPLH